MSSCLIDSHYASLDEALVGITISEEIRRPLALINEWYISFDGQLHFGQLVMHTLLVDDVHRAFEVMRKERFPIARMVPVAAFDWNDTTSMDANNSSGFNYREIAGTNRLSKHSYGFAIDLNPQQNPCIEDGIASPAHAVYEESMPGTLVEGGPIVEVFDRLGWTWGKRWKRLTDYMHLEKEV